MVATALTPYLLRRHHCAPTMPSCPELLPRVERLATLRVEVWLGIRSEWPVVEEQARRRLAAERGSGSRAGG